MEKRNTDFQTDIIVGSYPLIFIFVAPQKKHSLLVQVRYKLKRMLLCYVHCYWL